MAKYKWSFANVGNVTRVRIQSGEDIRHLGELDKKMWTVLSCPVNGLEISSDSLCLMDEDGDGKLRLKEVVATAEWLCSALKDPETLMGYVFARYSENKDFIGGYGERIKKLSAKTVVDMLSQLCLGLRIEYIVKNG